MKAERYSFGILYYAVPIRCCFSKKQNRFRANCVDVIENLIP